MKDKQFALLIDSENISVKYVDLVFEALMQYGAITYKRIYGDWTNNQSGRWKEVILQRGIIPIQQYSWVHGKNATDSALIIDAMDILYSNKVNGFCIVSSDSDFTRLVIRLREGGMSVIGMGERKTPEAFKASFEEFIYLDALLEERQEALQATRTGDEKEEDGVIHTGNKEEQVKDISIKEGKVIAINGELEGEAVQATPVKKIVGIRQIEYKIIELILASEKKCLNVGIIERGLQVYYPGFDKVDYGHKKISKLIESMPLLELDAEYRSVVRVNQFGITLTQLKQMIEEMVKEAGEEGISRNQIHKEICKMLPGFNARCFGYSKFTRLLEECAVLEVENELVIARWDYSKAL